MALSKRESRVLWLTIIVVSGVVLWQFGVGPLYADYAQTTDLLNTERKTYDDNRKILSRAPQIENQYKEIEAQFPKQEEGKRAEHSFSEDVIKEVEAIMGAKPKDVQPVTREPMKDVRGYDYLTFSLGVQGELAKVSQLLKSFDQKGFLIQNLAVSHPQLDNPLLRLDITLARIVKQEEQKKKGPAKHGTLSLGKKAS